MTVLSVVVPVYNVGPYLTACLESIAAQTWRDFEVVMVDDGSTDGSAALAAAFAARDPRFRLVRQANAGPGAARNTGVGQARGEFLAFVDSDDLVPPYALEYLLASLRRTGSDFATGHVQRFDGQGVVSRWKVLRDSHASTALGTHVDRRESLLRDRLVTNKLWRRSFWDAHGMRFPEGVLYEDTPVAVPAHFLARAVDVLSHPVYLWRIRPDGDKSITQDRFVGNALENRFEAAMAVREFLLGHGMAAQAARWDHTVAGDDLLVFLNVLDEGDDGYRGRFLDLALDYLATIGPAALVGLPAIERLKWHLVGERRLPELLEVLAFHKAGEVRRSTAVRKGRRLYGDYPFLGDPAIGVPDEVYRLGVELDLRQKVDAIRWRGDTLVIEGRVIIRRMRPDRRWKQQVQVWLVEEETGRRSPVRTSVVRADSSGSPSGPEAKDDWSGYRAAVPARRLRAGGSWRMEVWVLNRGVLRRADLGGTVAGAARRPDVHERDGLLIRPEWAQDHTLRLCAGRESVEVTGHVVVDGVLTLTCLGADALELVRLPGGMARSYPSVAGVVRIQLTDLYHPAADVGRWERSVLGEESRWELRRGEIRARLTAAPGRSRAGAR
ncbi:MAG: glycosyltransferase, partial [Streptosporangiaceae bacterium]